MEQFIKVLVKIDINIMLCPIKANSNTIELTVHTSCYCILDLLCVKVFIQPKVILKQNKTM